MDEISVKNQFIFSKILNKINNTSNSSQAYLLVGQSKELLNSYALLLSKVLICPKRYKEKCEVCNICKRIDDNNYGELEIINPINKVIKKEVIVSLRDKFQTQTIEGENQVYIINDAECLHPNASNALLKFIEEPNSKTTAIFTTTNFDKVINTIVSRCQVIKINNEILDNGNISIYDITGLDEEQANLITNLYAKIEKNSSMNFINNKQIINKIFNKKELLQKALMLLLLIYKDTLNYKVCGMFKYFDNNLTIKELAENQSIDEISKKISFLLESIAKLDYNVNILLFINNFLIGIGEIIDGKGNRN